MSTYKLVLAALLSSACLPLSAGHAAASEKSIMLVLDSSGSMKAKLPDGTSRMDAAKSAVAQLVSTLPADTALALRAYGHQSPQSAKNCKDSALLTPFDDVSKNKAAVIAKALSLQPQGYTPITYALTLAAEELASQEAPSHVVVLVSDGKETCEADPCAAAKALAAADARLVVHTIGAGVDEPTRSQLRCIASAARGGYFDANSTVELAAVVGKAAETKAVELPEEEPKKVAAKTTISQKSASADQKAPTDIGTGEDVKGRHGEVDQTQTYHNWKLSAPAGRYRLVLDAKLANDKHSNLKVKVEGFAPDGGAGERIITTNEIDWRTRDAAWIDAKGEDIVLRVENDSGIVDYWLAVYPADAEIPGPYFVRTPVITPIEFGKAAAGMIDPRQGQTHTVWYSATLKGQDYKVSTEFTRVDGKNTNIAGSIDMFGPIGEQLPGAESRVCLINEIGLSGGCEAKLVMAQDAQVLFRLSTKETIPFKTTFKIEPLD